MIQYQIGEPNMVEKKDCMVRALSNALGKPYYEAHSILRRLGRKNRHGTPTRVCWKAMLECGVPVMSPVKRRISHARFVAKHAKGRFIVLSRHHAWAIVDGVAFDSWRLGPRMLIRWFGKVSE